MRTLRTLRALRGLLSADALRVVRDRFLLAAVAYLLGMAVVMRWVLPLMARAARSRWSLDLEPYFPLIVSYLVFVLGAVAVGIVGGFILLETREEHTIVALRVSPLPLRVYVTGFSFVLMLSAAGVILAEAALIGLGLPPWPALVAIALVGGPGAPLVALYLATFPANKVEAFAHMKFVSVAGAIPLGAYFLPPPWQYLAGVFPPFWAAKAWWVAEAGGGSWPLWLLGGALTTGALLVWLSGRFQAAGLAAGRR